MFASVSQSPSPIQNGLALQNDNFAVPDKSVSLRLPLTRNMLRMTSSAVTGVGAVVG
jgi:hypothetical protein